MASLNVKLARAVKTSAIYRISEQGNLQQTENRFDLAIRGNGYFQVQLPSGEIAYTRDGTFGLSPEGVLVTAEGYVVQPGITIPAAATDVTINASGQVLAKLDGQVQPQNVGQVLTAIFANEGGLDAQGGNLFLATPASGAAQAAAPGQPGHGQVLQGFIVTDFMSRMGEFYQDMGGMLQAGKLQRQETVHDGLDAMPDAFLGLFSGSNTGKMLVRL